MTVSPAKSIRRNITAILLPSLITGGIMLLVYACFGQYPFREKSAAWCDMNQQVIPLMAEFRSILLGDGDFFWSPGAGGINFWGIFFFFLSSPFSLLAVFSSAEGLPWFMNWLILWKMMACAGSAGWFFRCITRVPEKEIPTTIMGVLYAFCGYSLYYYQNIVWLDMMALFPLLLLGLRHMETKRKILPFTAVLCSMLVVHYYLSYMIVLFLLFGYSLYLMMVSSAERAGKSIFLLGCSCALAMLLTAVVWLPSLLQVLTSARGEGLAAGLAKGPLESELATTLPTLFTTALPLASLFFIRKKTVRTGIFGVVAGMGILLLIPMIIRPINKMWHTGSYQSFPTRYGYITAMMLLLLGFWAIRNANPKEWPKKTKRTAMLILLGAAGGYLWVILWMTANNLDWFTAYTRTLSGDSESLFCLLGMLLIALAVYTLILAFNRTGFLSRRFFIGILSVVIITECFFNAGVYIGNSGVSQDGWVQAMDLKGKIEEKGFYRVKCDRKYFDVNLLSAMGYSSLSHYTSLTPETTLITQRRLGYSGYWMEVHSNGGTAFSDALLGNRYEITANSDLLSEDELEYRGEKLAIRKLDYQLPDAVLTKAAPGFLKELPAGSRMEIQQELAETIFPGSEDLFFLCQPDSIENLRISNGIYEPEDDSGVIHWEIPIEESTTLYFDCASAPTNALSEPVNKKCRIWVNGELVRKEYPTKMDNGILNLGTYSEGTVEITVEILKKMQPESFEVFGLRNDVLKEICENAQGIDLQGSGSHYVMNCQTEETQTLFLPISWDKGWSAKINGEKVSLYQTAGNYLSLEVPPGENQIELTYYPPGFQMGIVLTILGIIGSIVYAVRKISRYGEVRIVQRTALFLFIAISAAACLLVYVVPVVIWFLFHNS